MLQKPKESKKNKGFRRSACPSLTISGAEGAMAVKPLEEVGNRSAALYERKKAVAPVFLMVAKPMENVGTPSAPKCNPQKTNERDTFSQEMLQKQKKSKQK